MEKKHAIVIALTLLFLGMMFTSVDIPFVQQNTIGRELQEVPENNEQIADAPVPQEPLTLNVIPNPSFEDWNTADQPEIWSSSATSLRYIDDTYTGNPKHGSYAGYMESMGSVTISGYTNLRNSPDHSTYFSYLVNDISLAFDWYVLANPDISNFGQVYLTMVVQNTTGDSRVLYYFLSYSSSMWTNGTSNAYFLMNDTIGSWNSFNRNITEDFIAVFGVETLSSTHYVQWISFEIFSPVRASDKMQIVVDDVSLFNSTYSWLNNGDFEAGDGSSWSSTITQSTLSYLEKCTDSTDGTYSANMSLTAIHGDFGYARLYRSFLSQNSYFVYGPGTNVISWDWKYNDTAGGGASQYALLRVQFYNGTTYSVYFTMGRGDDYIPNNGSTYFHFAAPGFGTRGSWEHSEIDLYEITQQVGIGHLRISDIRFEAYQEVGIADAKLQVLIDDFSMKTHPMASPSFEYEDSVIYDSIQGWMRNGFDGEVTQTTEHHSGSYAANITVESGWEGIDRSELLLEFDPALSIDFWWRLEDIRGTSVSYAWIDFEFINHLGGNNHIIYVLGRSSSYGVTNGSQTYYYIPEGFNQTETWTLLSRNITTDIEAAFSYTGGDWTIYQVTARCYSGSGGRTSLLLDDFHFKDMDPPSVDSVSFDTTPMYYEDVYVQIFASDTRPGVNYVAVVYTTDNWGTFDTVFGVYDAGDWFNATIPAQAYNTEVKFFIQAVDGCGVPVIDANSGLYYSYIVGDDVDPTLTITDPVNNTDQSGLLTITADVNDPGSGIEYVTFNADGSGAINDYTAPYQQNWNLDDESLGSHYVIVTVRDNVGHEVSKTHYFTVVDIDDPVLDSPIDVAFDEGETGYTIDWDPTDIRPTSYEVFVDEISTYTGAWNESSEHIVISLDSLDVGVYNYTCVVYDEAGNYATDTVMVTVNEVATTTTTSTTSDTTTTDTSTIDTGTDTETTTGSTGGGDLLSPVLIVGIIGVVGVLLIVFFVLPKMKR